MHSSRFNDDSSQRSVPSLEQLTAVQLPIIGGNSVPAGLVTILGLLASAATAACAVCFLGLWIGILLGMAVMTLTAIAIVWGGPHAVRLDGSEIQIVSRTGRVLSRYSLPHAVVQIQDKERPLRTIPEIPVKATVADALFAVPPLDGTVPFSTRFRPSQWVNVTLKDGDSAGKTTIIMSEGSASILISWIRRWNLQSSGAQASIECNSRLEWR